MVKLTQAIYRLLLTSCFSLFYHSVGLARKGLIYIKIKMAMRTLFRRKMQQRYTKIN